MLLLAAFCLAMSTSIEAYYDGFTIEMPVWIELIPRLQPPLLAPFKETASRPNALNGEEGPARPLYNRPQQVEYSQPGGYPNYIQIQPKPLQFPGFFPQPAKPQEFYSPPKPVNYSPPAQAVQRLTSSTTSTTFPSRNEEEYGDEVDVDSLLR